MLTEDEARIAYDELLEKLRGTGAVELVREIERAVGIGRVQERDERPMQERLPAIGALEIALRMFAAWIEPAFLVAEAKDLLRESTGGKAKVEEVKWRPDRLDVVEAQTGALGPSVADQSVLEIPSLGTSPDDARGRVERLQEMIVEITAVEGD
jgi:hypothetical protein